MNAKPLIHVVDDDESLRAALLRLLAAARIDARGYASAGEFLLNPPEDRPGCLLLDLKMPGPSGMELHAALPSLGITLPVVFLTGHGDVHTGVRAMKGGAVDFLTKPVERETLLIALQRAVERDIAQRAARDEARKLAARFAVLSERERLVFDRIVDGLLNKQIADYLGVSERTVKADRAHVMAKLGVSSTAELGRIAERLKRSAADGCLRLMQRNVTPERD